MDLEIRNLRLALGGKDILKGMELPPVSANIVALIGPSGGGKSTLLRVWGGLLTPDAGEVILDGESLPRKEKELRAYRRHMGMVFQNWNLFYHLSALENLVLPLTRVHGFSVADAESKTLALLERFQLADHAHKKPHQLSGGQQQRVAILRALSVEPRCLLLDEPTSALDPEMAAQVLEMIEEVAGQGTPVILVTHHLAFARRVSDMILFLADGQITEFCSSEEFFKQPETEACQRFLDTVLRM
ncbi:amino acid ABC transporter ATP-binding protein [Kiritimatiellaeota bacterium B1221]|nr:amino acid ABC transporter ATP-binding protein [Kiritimatiellaeota bacterium B1221]